MYSQDKIDIARQVYHQCGSVTETIRVLGYPTRRALYTWIENACKSQRIRPRNMPDVDPVHQVVQEVQNLRHRHGNCHVYNIFT